MNNKVSVIKCCSEKEGKKERKIDILEPTNCNRTDTTVQERKKERKIFWNQQTITELTPQFKTERNKQTKERKKDILEPTNYNRTDTTVQERKKERKKERYSGTNKL